VVFNAPILSFGNAQAGPARIEAIIARSPAYTRRGLMRASVATAETIRQHCEGRPGPEIVSGTLHGSIKPEQVRTTGPGRYDVRVIVDDVPGRVRALELGHPDWAPGTKYPFIQPGLREMRQGRFKQIMAGSFREMVHDTGTVPA